MNQNIVQNSQRINIKYKQYRHCRFEGLSNAIEDHVSPQGCASLSLLHFEILTQI